MKLIVGLGNPGRTYGNSRHNIGFMCINHFAKVHGLSWDKRYWRARMGTGEVAGVEVILAKPQAFMNLSGESVGQLVSKFRINLNDLIVIHDDLDLPLGKLRIRQGGSSGGHRGVQSIINSLGSPDFIRIRVGIARPEANEASQLDIIDYVLGDFTPDEKPIIAQTKARVSEAILCILAEGLTIAMNKYN